MQYAKISTIAVPSNALHDSMNSLVLSDGDTSSDRLLFLTNNTIEVYRNDKDNFMSIRVTSVPLQSDCTPWFITGSSIQYNGVVYVKYRGDCGYSVFYYYFDTETFDDDPLYVRLPGQGAILSTKDDFDFEAYIENNGQQLRMMTMSQDFQSRISANLIADCAVLHHLNPLDPREEFKVFFTVTCTTDDGILEHYHIEYRYKVTPLNLTVTLLEPGVPISGDQYIAVRGDEALTVYDTAYLKSGVPGRHSFSGQISRLFFESVANQTWLVVQIENSDVYAVNVSLFVSSRGGEGVYQLMDTNIGLCVPSCLPVISSGENLIVFDYVGPNSYSCLVFDISTGMPQERKRILNLPERPFAAVYIVDPNFPQGTTTLAPEAPAANTLMVALPPSIGIIAVIAITVLLTIAYLGIRIRRKRRSNSASNLMIEENGMPLLNADVGRAQKPKPISLPISKLEDEDSSDPTTPLIPPQPPLSTASPTPPSSVPSSPAPPTSGPLSSGPPSPTNPAPPTSGLPSSGPPSPTNPAPPTAVPLSFSPPNGPTSSGPPSPTNPAPPTAVPLSFAPPNGPTSSGPPSPTSSVPSSPKTVSPVEEVALPLVRQETPQGQHAQQETEQGGQEPHAIVIGDSLKK